MRVRAAAAKSTNVAACAERLPALSELQVAARAKRAVNSAEQAEYERTSDQMRIVSLCPSNTDIVFALGAEHMLVGVDRWSLGDSDVAEQLAAVNGGVADVGTDLRIETDTIVSLQPDLVLASLSVPGMEENIAALDEHNLPYIIVDGHDIPGIRRGVLQVADALSLSKQGRTLVDAFDADVAAIRSRAAAYREQHIARGEGHALPQRAVWEWWPNPVIVAGRTSWIHDFFDILGVENVFADLDKESSPVETEEVLKRMPDTVCACWCGTLEPRMTVAKIAGRPGWHELPAVKTRRIFLLPEKLFGRPGPHLTAGLHELYELFYGDRAAATERTATAASLAPDATTW